MTAPDGRSKGFGIVVYGNAQSAEKAIAELNELEPETRGAGGWGASNLTVVLIKKKKKREEKNKAREINAKKGRNGKQLLLPLTVT